MSIKIIQDVRIETLENGSHALDNKLTDLESADVFLQEANKQLAVRTTEIENKSKKIEVDVSQVTEEFQKGFTLKVESKLEKMEESLDVLNKNKINNDANMSDLIARLDDHEDKIENMQTDIETGKNITKKLSSTTENNSEIISQTQKQITNVAENVEKNEKDITNIFSSLAKLNTENQDMHSESMVNITRIYEAIHEQNTSLENTIKELNNDHDKVTSFELLISTLTAETDGLKAQISHEMQTSVENFEEGQTKLQEAFKEHLSNFSAQVSKLDKVETDADVANSDLKNLLERFTKLQNDLQSLDVKHVETVERMKEVTVLATNIEVHVKSQEQRIEQQNEEGLTNVNKKIAMLEGDLDSVQKKIADVDNKGLSLSGNVQTINQTLVSKLDELKKVTDDLEARLNNASADHSKKMETLQDLHAENTDKIKGLEEASMQHFERARYFETLNTRVAQLDEMRQQSEAKARDEVDMGISKQNSLVNEFKLDVDNKVQNLTLHFQENFYKSEQENNQLREQILHLKAEIDKCYLTINGLNGEFGNISGKIQGLESGFDTQLKNISAKTDYAESSLAKEVEQLNEKASELNSKLKYLEHENMNNIAEIVAVKEASFAHNEKVTFVEALSARVSSFDDSRQQFEEDLMKKNEEMIAKNASAITDLKQECEGRLKSLEAETKSGFAKTAGANDGLAVSLENLRKENENLGTWFKDLQERHVQLQFIFTEQNQTNQTFVLEKQQELEAKIEKSLLQSQENNKTDQESGISELREMIETTSNNLRAEIQDKADKENVDNLQMFKNSLKKMEDEIKDVATCIQKAEENFAVKVDENVQALRSDLEEKLKEQEYDCKELYKTNEKLESKVEILEMGIAAQLEDIEKLRDQDELTKQEVKDTQEAETSRRALMQNTFEERMKALEDKLDQFQTSLGESQLNQNEIIIRESKELISKMKIEIDLGAEETDKNFKDGLKAMEEKIQKLETDVLGSLENKLVQEIKDSHLVLKGETGLKIKMLEDDIEGQKLVVEDKFNNCLEQFESNKVQLKTEVGNSSREMLSEIQNDLDEKLANIDILVKEAENHVENLRSLNGKLIDQVKENMKGHEIEQGKIAENLKQQTDEQLEKYKNQVEDELKTLISIKDEHTLTLTSMSNTIISVRETLSKSIEEFKETEKRIDALEKGQIVQDEEIDKNKETLKDQLQDLMAKIALNQSDLENHLKIYEDEKKMTQQRLDDSGISMSEIDEKLSFLAENNETKDQTINEMNKSFETSIHVFSSQFETKLAEDHKAFTDRLQRAEDNVLDNSMAIKANTSLIQQNGDNIASLLTACGKHDEEFAVVKVEIQKLKVNEQKESEESLKKIEILSSKVESEIKRLDQIKHQVSDLDDAVTHLSPDIITNAEKILVLEVFKKQLEVSTENLQKEVEEFKSAEEKSRSEIEELKEDTEKLGEILETLQDKFDNLEKETSDRFKDDNTKIEEVSGLLSNIKLSVEENKEENLNKVENVQAALESQLQELKKDLEAKTVILGNDVIDLRDQLTKFETRFSEVPPQLEEHKKNTENEIKNLKEKQFDDVKNLKDQLDEFLDKFAIVQVNLDEIKATNVKMENIENNISQQFNLKIASSMMESKDAQEENQKRLDDLKENMNEETAKLSVIIMSMKSSFEDGNKLIVDDIDKLKSADNELMNEMNNNKNSFNLKLESLNSDAQSLTERVTGVENENKEQNDRILQLETNQKDQLEKIVSLHENTAAYEEKAKYVQVLEAKVEKVDEMRQKSESQAKEDFKQAIMTNKDNIEKLRADVDKSIQELGDKHDDDVSNLSSAVAEMKNNLANSVGEVKEDCNILKSEGVVFKDTLAKYQELLEVKLKEVDNNTNENSRVIQVVKDMLNETNDKIDNNQASFNTDLNSLKDETPALIEKTLDFFKTDVKEEITALDNDFNELKKNIEPLELGFTKLGKELEENSQKQLASLNDLKNVSQDMLAVLRNDFDGKVKEIMEYFDKQGKTIAINNTYMMSSQELLNNISISSVEQAAKIEALESQTGILDNKLSSLESADLFLQEAHRMLTDKTTLVETESKRLEAAVLAHMKDQKEEHEDNLKSQISLILKDIDKLEADKSKAFEKINDVENQAQGNQNQITALEAKFLNQTNDLSTNLETMIADIKTSQENKLEILEENIVLNKAIVQNSIEELNNNLTGNDEKIKQFEDSLKALDVKHVETTQKMKEVTVLATNIEVHIKSQEQKFEEQKALDMTGFENSFKEIKEKEVMLQEKLESLEVNCQETMHKIEDLEFRDKEKNALVDEILDKIRGNSDLIGTSNASIHDILAKLQSLNDQNKNQAEKMHVIEMLSDRLDQLDDSRSTHDIHVTTTIENLREEYKKNLTLINLEIDNKLTVLQDSELSKLHQMAEALKEDLVKLRTENEGQGRSIIELGNNGKEANARYEEQNIILETKLSQALSEIQILLAKVESIDDENKYNKEKLVAMEEAAVTQSEKAVYVESLMSRMDDMRQQSEVKSKEELQTKIQSQSKAVDELRNELETKLGNISRDIRGELDSLNLVQEQLSSKLHLDNKAALETLGNEQETKITAIMKIIHDHKTLIEKTHSSITTITERIVHTESSQSNSQEKIIADYAQKLAELKDNFEERIVELFMQSGVQKANIEKNTSLIEELSVEFNSSSGQLKGEITNIKVCIMSKKCL